MKIALIGYGVMGKLVETAAQRRGYEICAQIDTNVDLDAQGFAERIVEADAAIDFSHASAVARSVEACCLARVPLIEGTTGWNSQLDEIEQVVTQHRGTLVYAANFSIGVNLFYRIAEFAAELFSKFDEYEAFIEERHHSRKVDAPSGTALKIKEIVAVHNFEDVSVSATRAGNIPGSHLLGFDGVTDQVVLQHTARSREGFALGAVTAAEWAIGKNGVFEWTQVIDEILG
ncbi:MAG: 4-hydroxy-tetrahydrodipicolinate reductase [Pyrinomonadaceae bacterium]